MYFDRVIYFYRIIVRHILLKRSELTERFPFSHVGRPHSTNSGLNNVLQRAASHHGHVRSEKLYLGRKKPKTLAKVGKGRETLVHHSHFTRSLARTAAGSSQTSMKHGKSIS